MMSSFSGSGMSEGKVTVINQISTYIHGKDSMYNMCENTYNLSYVLFHSCTVKIKLGQTAWNIKVFIYRICYLFRVKNGNTRTMCGICSKLTKNKRGRLD